MISARNLLLTLNTLKSYTFARETFSSLKLASSADILFMLGNLEPAIKHPNVDILILRAMDEAKFDNSTWDMAIFKYLNDSYKYKHTDWNNYKLPISLRKMGFYDKILTPFLMNSYLKKMKFKTFSLINRIISQAKVIITDRLHASIFSLLIGRPHVIIEDKYNQISSVRNFAFKNFDWCSIQYQRSYYAKNPEEAIKKAVEILISDY
jgi:exopolysaccharide biosynthesis predicted pyruvyltransferase EpsI